MGAGWGYTTGAYDKGVQVDLGSNLENNSEIDSEASEGQVNLPIHKYPFNLESGGADAHPECIHFTAVKQGGISFEGDAYKANAAATKADQMDKVLKKIGPAPALLTKPETSHLSEKALEKYQAAKAVWYKKGGELRTNEEVYAEQHTLIDKLVGTLKTQDKNIRTPAKDLEHCFLYMPTGITYAEGAEWGVEQLGALGNLVKEGLTGKNKGVDDMLKNFGGGTVMGIAKAAATAAGAAMGGMLGGAGGFILGTELGKGLKSAGRFATNPYEEQMFNGIPFRSFSFDFTFTPSSEDEGKQVFKIIKMFRKHSRPGFVGGIAGEGLFSFPNEFKIEFKKMQGGGLVNNKSLPKIHNCVCTNVTTNFTPEGFWVALRDGNPLSTTLSLAFNETKKITQKQIDLGY